MFKKSMIEVAYEVLKGRKTAIKFVDLWKKVAKELDLTDEEYSSLISRFYTQLSLDEKFVLLEDNAWDLRERHKFSKVHIDMNDVYSEIEEEIEEDEEDAEDEDDDEYDDEEYDDEEEDDEDY
jgi:DNA-directed RNA polymerase subunit delta